MLKSVGSPVFRFWITRRLKITRIMKSVFMGLTVMGFVFFQWGCGGSSSTKGKGQDGIIVHYNTEALEGLIQGTADMKLYGYIQTPTKWVTAEGEILDDSGLFLPFNLKEQGTYIAYMKFLRDENGIEHIIGKERIQFDIVNSTAIVYDHQQPDFISKIQFRAGDVIMSSSVVESFHGGNSLDELFADLRLSIRGNIPESYGIRESIIKRFEELGVDAMDVSIFRHWVNRTRTEYDFSSPDSLIENLASRGLKTILDLGLNPAFPWYSGSPYVSEKGHEVTGRADMFDPRVRQFLREHARVTAKHYDDNDNVVAFWVAIQSYYGEVELYADLGKGFYQYSESAQASFKNYLQWQYANLDELNHAWGTAYAQWEEVAMPQPDYGKALQLSQAWSDFMHWRHYALLEAFEDQLRQVRMVTSKPIVFALGGWKTGLSTQGIHSASVNDIMLLAEKYKPIIVNDTDGTNLYSTRYTMPAAVRLGFGRILENTPDMGKGDAERVFWGALAGGAQLAMAVHIGTYVDMNTGETKPPYGELQKLVPLYDDFRTEPVLSEVAFFHSFKTPWFTPGFDYNRNDGLRVFDRGMASQHFHNAAADWSRYFQLPEIIDEAAILAGWLENYRVLVVPNSSYIVTDLAVRELVEDWVRNGNVLVVTGKGAFTHVIDDDLRIQEGDIDDPTTWVGGMVGAISAGTSTSRKWYLADEVPSWLAEGIESGRVKITGNLGRSTSVILEYHEDVTPVIVDEDGNAVLVYRKLDDGHILFTAEGIPEPGKIWTDLFLTALPEIAHELMLYVGVYPWVESIPRDIQIVYGGCSEKSGEHLFVASNLDMIRSSVTIRFNEKLAGPAILIGPCSNRFSVKGGSLEYMESIEAVMIRFELPTELTIQVLWEEQ